MSRPLIPSLYLVGIRKCRTMSRTFSPPQDREHPRAGEPHFHQLSPAVESKQLPAFGGTCNNHKSHFTYAQLKSDLSTCGFHVCETKRKIDWVTRSFPVWVQRHEGCDFTEGASWHTFKCAACENNPLLVTHLVVTDKNITQMITARFISSKYGPQLHTNLLKSSSLSLLKHLTVLLSQFFV